MNIDKLDALLSAQREILGGISSGMDLSACLLGICQRLQSLATDQPFCAAIMGLEGDGLFVKAAPDLPSMFTNAVDGMMVRPNQGACGAAVCSKAAVTIADVSTDHRCERWRALLSSCHIGACHSTPIHGVGNILGTLSVYFKTPCEPKAELLSLIEFFSLLASVAIKKYQADQREHLLHQQLTEHIDRFMAFGRVIPDLGLVLDEEGIYVDIYGSEDHLMGGSRQHLLGKRLSDFLPSHVAKGVMKTIAKTIESNDVQLYEYKLPGPDGDRVFEGRTAPLNNYTSSTSSKRHVVWMARDITTRKFNENKMHHMAFYDDLTNLPNRRLIFDRLEQLIKRIKRQQVFSSLIFIDLDDFKLINDSHGHSIGDDFLKAFSQRIAETMRGSDTLGRLGGDEFVILLESNSLNHDLAVQEAESLCQRIIDLLKQPFYVEENYIKCSASLGVSVISADDNSADDVLSFADSAMYQAKKQGKGQAFFYRL